MTPSPRVLMAEDEMCLAMVLGDLLEDAGYQVLRAANLSDGMAIAEREPLDVAILDINLGSEAAYPLAAQLRLHGVPFLFASANGERGLPEEYRTQTVLQKPYSADRILAAVAALLAAPAPERPPS